MRRESPESGENFGETVVLRVMLSHRYRIPLPDTKKEEEDSLIHMTFQGEGRQRKQKQQQRREGMEFCSLVLMTWTAAAVF